MNDEPPATSERAPPPTATECAVEAAAALRRNDSATAQVWIELGGFVRDWA